MKPYLSLFIIVLIWISGVHADTGMSWPEEIARLQASVCLVEYYQPQAELGEITEKSRISNAVEKIKEARPRIFAELDISEDRLTPSAIFYQLDITLRQMKDEAKTSDPAKDTKPWEDAIAVLKEIPVPMRRFETKAEIAKKLEEFKTYDSEQVLDRLIAALRHEHIQAVRMYGCPKMQESLKTYRQGFLVDLCISPITARHFGTMVILLL